MKDKALEGWSVGDFITHRVRGPGIVELVQCDRIRVKWGQNGVQTWVSTRLEPIFSNDC